MSRPIRRSIEQFLLILLCWYALGTARAQGDTPAEPLIIGPEQTVNGDLATTTQSVVVQGTVVGDVTTWSGDITVEGRVGGDVVSYSGTITLEQAAEVDGNVLTVGGKIQQHESNPATSGAIIEGTPGGSVVFGLIDIITPSSSDGAAASQPVVRAAFAFAAMLVLLALCTIGTLLWPRRAALTSLTLRATPGRSFALGVLTTLLLSVALVPTGALLALTLIGMPFLLPLLLALHLPYMYGLATVGQLLGWRIFSRRRELATTVGVLLILLPLVLLSIVAPTASLLLFYLVASLGLGAILLSRAGTRPVMA